MADQPAPTIVERLKEHREVARRLMLSTPDLQWLRGLVVELIGIIVGDNEIDQALETSGGRHPAPLIYRAPAPYVAPPPRGPEPMIARSEQPQPRAPMTLEAAAEIARKRREAAPKGAVAPVVQLHQPAPDPKVPDPAGPDFIANLQAQLDEQESAETDTTTTDKGA